MAWIERATEILQQQLEGIKAIKITSEYQETIDLLASCYSTSKRIVTSGMGKAGIIARKMSATLASIGFPSFFLHPAESLHGDIGRIGKEDVLILFSNSGKTTEVIKMVSQLEKLHVKSNPIIYIGSNPNPTFDCQIIITYPSVPESCRVSKVPSTSTTQMLVIADVLAITAAEKSGLSDEWFKLRHPGGAIGEEYKKP